MRINPCNSNRDSKLSILPLFVDIRNLKDLLCPNNHFNLSLSSIIVPQSQPRGAAAPKAVTQAKKAPPKAKNGREQVFHEQAVAAGMVAATGVVAPAGMTSKNLRSSKNASAQWSNSLEETIPQYNHDYAIAEQYSLNSDVVAQEHDAFRDQSFGVGGGAAAGVGQQQQNGGWTTRVMLSSAATSSTFDPGQDPTTDSPFPRLPPVLAPSLTFRNRPKQMQRGQKSHKT
jgi:hypothetical protein